MAKRRPLTAITEAAERPIEPDRVPSTVHRTPPTSEAKRLTWEERTQRKTYHAEKATFAALAAHSETTGESLSSLINRAQRELLERETKGD